MRSSRLPLLPDEDFSAFVHLRARGVTGKLAMLNSSCSGVDMVRSLPCIGGQSGATLTIQYPKSFGGRSSMLWFNTLSAAMSCPVGTT